MTYRISGLDPAPFRLFFGLSDRALEARGIIGMIADSRPGFPCRVLLDDVPVGQRVLLMNHMSRERRPYRACHAIFVADGAAAPARFDDSVPPALDRRILSLRAFNGAGLMVDAALAQVGEADAVIRRLFEDERVDHLDAHNAIRGCFAARVERD